MITVPYLPFQSNIMDSTTVYSPEYLAEDRSARLMSIAITFGILETMFVSLYFCSKFKNKTVHGLDTYLMIPAFLCALSNPIMAFRESPLHFHNIIYILVDHQVSCD
jgi:hypothetical protein